LVEAGSHKPEVTGSNPVPAQSRLRYL
jgi:hypothetical protein